MKRKILLFIVAASAIVIGVSIPFAFGTTGVNPQLESQSMVQKIALKGAYAEPALVFVRVGEKVRFASRDGQEHAIAGGKGSHDDQAHEHKEEVARSAIFAADEAYEITFPSKGTFDFHDHFHPTISATVIVY